MACRKTARRVGGTKKRAQRATSNVFAMFDQDQIQEFKEAFNMIDQNRDGFIDHDDLKDMLASLGKVGGMIERESTSTKGGGCGGGGSGEREKRLHDK
jgi:hypothetical protein